MLKTKIFRAFALLVLVFGLVSAFIGLRIITERVIGEAQTQVSVDINAAWEIFRGKQGELKTILNVVAMKKAVVDATADQAWDSGDLRHRLEVIQRTFNLDFMGVVSPEGRVVIRTVPPHNTNDFRVRDPAIARALKGEAVFGIEVMSKSDLLLDGDGLVERAFLAFEPTQRARPSPKNAEERGMVMIGAVPILKGMQVTGVLYGGILLNRNQAMVDRMTEVVFRKATYQGKPMGTATLFLDDCRIATTVTLPNGNRALGTRASKEVADRVLDNGQSWLGPAFVVKDSYLSAYDPIRDLDGHIVGMLYVGHLEKPYNDLSRSIMMRYAGLLVGGLVAALILAFFIAGRVADPIHALVEVAKRMHRGEAHTSVAVPNRGACDEVKKLVESFNEMGRTLHERERSLKEANAKLGEANQALVTINQSYMNMLGFVSHELKSPLASIMNYAFLLQQGKIGPMNEAQARAARNIESGTVRIAEMVRHYLNLSRIEKGEFSPAATRVAVLGDVVRGLLELYDGARADRRMRVEVAIDPALAVHADMNMTREVFENIVGNAIKYGREGGLIRLKARVIDSMVEFTVWNEGDGIPAEKMDALFKKFTRLGTPEGIKAQRGTGLGLFIAKHIVEAHGGRISVRTEAGQWVEFTFTLPGLPSGGGH